MTSFLQNVNPIIFHFGTWSTLLKVQHGLRHFPCDGHTASMEASKASCFKSSNFKWQKVSTSVPSKVRLKSKQKLSHVESGTTKKTPTWVCFANSDLNQMGKEVSNKRWHLGVRIYQNMEETDDAYFHNKSQTLLFWGEVVRYWYWHACSFLRAVDKKCRPNWA